jgi:molybdopterin synthase sulfur carrier subunit
MHENTAETEDRCMATVRVPFALRKYTDGKEAVEAYGCTVWEVLETLVESYPGLQERICHDGGTIRSFVKIFLNKKEVSPDELDTPVYSYDEIAIVPSFARGV